MSVTGREPKRAASTPLRVFAALSQRRIGSPVSSDRATIGVPPGAYQPLAAFGLAQQISAMLLRNRTLNLADRSRCLQSIALVPESAYLEQPRIGHHVLKAQVGEPSQLEQLDQRQIEAQLAGSGRFAPDTRRVTFQPTR